MTNDRLPVDLVERGERVQDAWIDEINLVG